MRTLRGFACPPFAIVIMLLTIRCTPKPVASQPRVEAPPPSAAHADPNANRQFEYKHSVQYGDLTNAMQEALRNEYVVAVARVGDTSMTGTPFGDVEVKTAPILAGAVGEATGGEEAKVKVGVDESLRQEKLRPEPTPAGFSLTRRRQIISMLQETGCFTVVERESINDIIRELQFSQSEWTNKNAPAAQQGALRGVRYILKGGLELNESALKPKPVVPDEWVGDTGFPEGGTDELPFVFRLRMYSVETGIIVAVGDGYAQTRSEAVNNAVTALKTCVVRHYHRTHPSQDK